MTCKAFPSALYFYRTVVHCFNCHARLSACGRRPPLLEIRVLFLDLNGEVLHKTGQQVGDLRQHKLLVCVLLDPQEYAPHVLVCHIERPTTADVRQIDPSAISIFACKFFEGGGRTGSKGPEVFLSTLEHAVVGGGLGTSLMSAIKVIKVQACAVYLGQAFTQAILDDVGRGLQQHFTGVPRVRGRNSQQHYRREHRNKHVGHCQAPVHMHAIGTAIPKEERRSRTMPRGRAPRELRR